MFFQVSLPILQCVQHLPGTVKREVQLARKELLCAGRNTRLSSRGMGIADGGGGCQIGLS
jgi:hypothetical protein